MVGYAALTHPTDRAAAEAAERIAASMAAAIVRNVMMSSPRGCVAGMLVRNVSLRDAAQSNHLDKSALGDYLSIMNIIRRTLDIDADTDARLREMADERGQDVAAVLAEAVALLDSVVDIAGPDIGEDRRRLAGFKQTRVATPLDDVKNWVASWGSAHELPRPTPRKIG